MKNKEELGLIVGKFYPFHKGHELLVRTGMKQVKKLVVVVCELSSERIAGEVRAGWIRELFADVEVKVRNYDGLDPDSHELWAKLAIEWLDGKKPDVVFTSESYGEGWAKAIGCRHELVDMKRERVTISGTKVRENPFENWDFISEPVRAYFVKRVVIVGAESTGKTTLAQDLAKELKTIWVPEYGRMYAEGKLFDGKYGEWTSEEFEHIARMQNEMENTLARKANKVLICDTDAFATGVWHERYMGKRSKKVEELDEGNKDFYLVADVDIPFVQDGTRDGEKIRKWMHENFLKKLEKKGVEFAVISGDREERVSKAKRIIEELVARGW